MTTLQISHAEVDQMQAQAATEGKACVVGALIANQHRHIFVQKRSPTRRLFPNCWDIAGGHVEAGETLYEALAREIHEETGWQLSRILAVVEVFDWAVDHPMREFDFLVNVEGDLNNPVLEAEKFSEYRWIGLDEVEILRENRTPPDEVIYRVVKRGLEMVADAP